MKQERGSWGAGLAGLLVAVAVGSATSPASGATVKVEDRTLTAGFFAAEASVSLDASSTEDVAAAQFDLVFDSATLTLSNFALGDSAASAEKDLSVSVVDEGHLRIVIVGVPDAKNRNVIPDGDLLTFRVKASESAAAGTEALNLSGLILSDPDGNEVPSTAQSGAMTVRIANLGVNAHGPLVYGVLAAALLFTGLRVFRPEGT